jgi:hypothetical protein
MPMYDLRLENPRVQGRVRIARVQTSAKTHIQTRHKPYYCPRNVLLVKRAPTCIFLRLTLMIRTPEIPRNVGPKMAQAHSKNRIVHYIIIPKENLYELQVSHCELRPPQAYKAPKCSKEATKYRALGHWSEPSALSTLTWHLQTTIS